MSKYDEEKFLIEVDLNNRNFVTQVAMFQLTIGVSVFAIFMSAIAIIISMMGTTNEALVLAFCLFLSGIPFFIHIYKSFKREIESAREFNRQYQKRYGELFLKNKKSS